MNSKDDGSTFKCFYQIKWQSEAWRTKGLNSWSPSGDTSRLNTETDSFETAHFRKHLENNIIKVKNQKQSFQETHLKKNY